MLEIWAEGTGAGRYQGEFECEWSHLFLELSHICRTGKELLIQVTKSTLSHPSVFTYYRAGGVAPTLFSQQCISLKSYIKASPHSVTQTASLLLIVLDLKWIMNPAYSMSIAHSTVRQIRSIPRAKGLTTITYNALCLRVCHLFS